MTLRARLVTLAVIVALAIAGAVAYVLVARSDQQEQARDTPAAAQTSLATVLAGPHVVFRNMNRHTGYGDVAVVALDDPAGPRAITSTECDRVYAARSYYLCLSSDAGVVATTYAAHILNQHFTVTQKLPLTGIPSRARMSADGRYAATTSFTAGDSYAATSFSTRTVITAIGGASLGSLENFTLVHDGQDITPVDRNYWGVTFAANDDTFYATVAFSGHTWLVRGSMSQRKLTTLHEDAECPSLSPDGRTIVYKQRGNLPLGKWRLVSYDVATGRVTPLAETHSIDDQVEWLDDSHVMYGVPRGGTDAGVSDVWTVPADGTGKPRLLIPEAWSPAVVR